LVKKSKSQGFFFCRFLSKKEKLDLFHLITSKVEGIDNFMPFVEKRMVHNMCNLCFLKAHSTNYAKNLK
jgi:hypothetical protein